MTHAMTPRANYRPYTEAECAAFRAAGRTTRAGAWDCATRDERVAMFPQLNPDKRWFEQKAWRLVQDGTL